MTHLVKAFARRSIFVLSFLLVGLLAACSQPEMSVDPPPSDDPPPVDSPAPTPTPQPSAWQPLFTESDLTGWKTWFASRGANSDPNGIFKLEDGVLHILDVAADAREEGYLMSLETYSSYHLRFEYQWGEKRFGNEDAPRGGGLLYHAGGPDKIWPRSLEFQLQERDTGDLWLIGRTTAETTIAPGSDPVQFQEGGDAYTTKAAPYTRLKKSETTDTSAGWNRVELIVSEDAIEHRVNGVVVNRITHPVYDGGPLDSGHLVFQAQNSEIFLRNVEIMPLTSAAP